MGIPKPHPNATPKIRARLEELGLLPCSSTKVVENWVKCVVVILYVVGFHFNPVPTHYPSSLK